MGQDDAAHQLKVRRETGSNLDVMQCRSDEAHLGDLTCPICLKVFVEPMQCKQGHVFCKACIEKTLKKKEECPMDRSRLQVADLSRARVVETLMDRMRVRCPHASQHADGAEHCDWLGPVSERQAHVDDECEHTLVPCPHDGCEVRVQRRMVSEHTASCEQRVEACELCSVGVVVAHHAQHEEECPMKRVTCPRLGCGALSRRKELEEHEAVCPMVQVECAFAVCGCTVGTLLRKDVAGHERDAAAVHAALALQESKSRTNETAQLRKEISALTKETAKLKPETVSLKQEVRTLQAELRRNAEAATKPVSVKWRVENIEAKLASCDEFSSKEIRIQSAAGPQTPLCFLAIIKFKKEAGEMSLYFQSICDNPTDLKGTSATLCNADTDRKGGLERTFTTDALLPGYASWGWPKFVSFAELRESHVAADGSITILATLVTRQVLDV